MSDRMDRRLVIFALTFIAAISAFVLAAFGGRMQEFAAVLTFFAWGAGALSFYGLAVAHMADRAEPGRLAQSAAGLLFVWAAGSIIGPLVLGPVVDLFGIEGMFWFAGGAALLVSLAMFWRKTARESAASGTKEEFSPQLGTSVAAGEIAYGDDKPRPS
jgi:MFS family permease